MEVTLGLAESLASIAERIFTVHLIGKMFTILGISIFTFKILDLFLETNIAIAKRDRLSPQRYKMLMYSIFTVLCMVMPIAAAGNWLWHGRLNVVGAIVLAIIVIIGNFGFGGALKRLLDKNDSRRKQKYMLGIAFGIMISIIAARIAYWIQLLIIGLINLILNIFRTPFILNYLLIGTLINLGLSLALTKFIGSSQLAGEVNIIGSLIGGLCHGILRRKHIRELRDELVGVSHA